MPGSNATTGSDASRAVLVAAIRHTLGRDAARPDCPEVLLREAILLAEKNKLLVELASALADWGIAPPVDMLAAIARYRAKARRKAELAHDSLVALGAALDSADIPWIAYKGVIAQTQLGLEAAHRPSNDLDVLVHHADFKRALQVLDEAACHHDEQFAGPWWQDWLGEVPVRPPGGIGLTIDLHHKLQQPGCPAPRHIGEWLDNRVHIALGGLSVPAPDAVSLGLLCAINVVKAFAHRELAGSHAMDLARILLREGPGFHADLEQFALRQGMTETLAMARQAVAALIGAPIPGKRARLAWEPDWIGMILTPSQQTDERMRGRTLLWALSEGRSLARVARFARDSWDAVASERSRRRHDVAPVAVRAATS